MNIRTLIGILIVITVTLVTFFGDWIAPHDARARHAVSIADDTVIAPPFPIGTPGFILGSDQYGRDLLSRIIVGTKPTMLTILIVALLRLMIGCSVSIIVVLAPRIIRGVLTTLTSVIGAIPEFVAALIVLTLQPDTTLAIFVLALTWSSWTNVAKEMHIQLTELRRQPFYLAAQSGGDRQYSILVRHGGRIFAPVLQRLFIREVRAALTVLAMVGFLGYFVGGATWIIVAGDAIPIGARAADYPELGQLLATSFERVLRPEALIVVGTYIGSIIVGLQLVLMQPIALPRIRPPWIQDVQTTVEWWLAGRSAAWLVVSVIALGASMLWVITPTTPTMVADTRPAPIIMQRNHPWAMEGGDASQSYRSATLDPPQQLETIRTPLTITSAPVMSARGEVYVYATSQLLQWHQGQWRQFPLPFLPIGSPALDPTGNVVVVAASGDIAHISPDGVVLRTYRTTTRALATSSAVVDLQGNVAVTVVDRIELFDTHGTLRWATTAIAGYNEFPPLLSPDGTIIVLANQAFDVVDGGRLPLFAGNQSTEYEGGALVGGADGYLYRRASHSLTQLAVDGFIPTELRILDWDATKVTMFFPQRSGVTARGVGWQLYSGYGNRATFVWMYGQRQYHTTALDAQSRLLSVADNATALFCNAQRIYARTPGTSTDIWTYSVHPSLGICLGGAFGSSQNVVAYTDGLVWYASPQTR